MADETVPGMAEAIERRRVECGLTPTEFAKAAELTIQGLIPIRKGYRREYMDKSKRGIARALRWPPDAIDRLLRGESAEEFETTPPDALVVVDVAGLAAAISRLDTELDALRQEVTRLRRQPGEDQPSAQSGRRGGK